MEAVNAAWRAAMREFLPRYDSQGDALLHEGRKWITKGKVRKICETP